MPGKKKKHNRHKSETHQHKKHDGIEENQA
jgi:hypothetical protein